MSKYALVLALSALIYVSAQSATRAASPKVLFMEATAFSRAPEPTAAGTEAHDGTVAADPRILPLGSRIRVTGVPGFNGTYLVTDTGADVKGMHIDIYMPSTADAKRFGTKRVRVTVLRIGTGPASARRKDTASPPLRKN
ncbi:MAG TPA: 3D domain-containing protein [Bryobacteraceae bacterium]|nr:3D domain-containing protein [Bryobacteraceae bacterium]